MVRKKKIIVEPLHSHSIKKMKGRQNLQCCIYIIIKKITARTKNYIKKYLKKFAPILQYYSIVASNTKMYLHWKDNGLKRVCE